MRALPAILVLLTGSALTPPVLAQTWEAAPVGVWQTQTSSTYWEQGTTSAWGLRGSWLASRDGASRLRVDAGWTAPGSWSATAADGSHAHLRAQSVALGMARETWFLDDRFCFSVALDLRTTWLESDQAGLPRVTNHLPQVWMRVGLGARVWAFSPPDRQSTSEPARYGLIRLELGEAAPRGPSPTDELLPQQEVTLACAVRF